MIRVKRVFDPPARADGVRILVDRLWPRGLSREEARLDAWLKVMAPTDALRLWFGHDPRKWDEFRTRYRAELDATGKIGDLMMLARRATRGPVTLLYAPRDEMRNNAVVLKELVEEIQRRTE